MELKKCGTRTAYARHLRKKETPCAPCKAANAAKRKEYYQRNQQKIYQINLAWASRNKEKVRSYRRIADAKRRAAGFKSRNENYKESTVIELYGTLCHICSSEIDFNATRKVGEDGWQLGLHLDHIVPLSKGGPDTIENIRPAHAVCNIRKGNR